MPSPFPGMDPYLEDPALWPDFHHEFITQMRAELNRILRPRYFVRVETRVYMPDEDDLKVAIPDVRVSEWQSHRRPDDAGGVAVIDEPLVVPSFMETEVKEAYLEIIAADLKRVVTVIEVTSPSNKVPNSAGWESFQRKRREVLQSQINWVEIDLLRAGGRSGGWRSLPPHDYLVHAATRVERRRDALWPFRVRDRFPCVGIPLLPEDKDCALQLGKVFAQSYENAAYGATIDCRKEPPVPLNADDAVWADEWLREKQAR